MIFNDYWGVAQLFMKHLLQHWVDRICPLRNEVHAFLGANIQDNQI